MSEATNGAGPGLGWLLLIAGLLQPIAGCDRLLRYEAALSSQDSRIAPGGDTGHPAADGASADTAASQDLTGSSDTNTASAEIGPTADAAGDLPSVVDLADARVVSLLDRSVADLAQQDTWLSPDSLPWDDLGLIEVDAGYGPNVLNCSVCDCATDSTSCEVDGSFQPECDLNGLLRCYLQSGNKIYCSCPGKLQDELLPLTSINPLTMSMDVCFSACDLISECCLPKE